MKIEDLEKQIVEENEHAVGKKVGFVFLALGLAVLTALIIFL